jgi:hypothetical protein
MNPWWKEKVDDGDLLESRYLNRKGCRSDKVHFFGHLMMETFWNLDISIEKAVAQIKCIFWALVHFLMPESIHEARTTFVPIFYLRPGTSRRVAHAPPSIPAPLPCPALHEHCWLGCKPSSSLLSTLNGGVGLDRTEGGMIQSQLIALVIHMRHVPPDPSIDPWFVDAPAAAMRHASFACIIQCSVVAHATIFSVHLQIYTPGPDNYFPPLGG